MTWHEVKSEPQAAPRLAFLDALRALAAVVVVVSHGAPTFISGYAHFDAHVFRLGQFGVVVFFFCSGFIIPASLERHDSLRGFWISRFFRLFPLYWAMLAAVVLAHVAGRYQMPLGYAAHPARAILLNLTMLQAFMRAPVLIGLSWTLAFELGFYVLASGLFVIRANRQSLPLAGAMLSITLALAIHSGSRSVIKSVPFLLIAAGFVVLVLSGSDRPTLLRAVPVAVIASLLIFNGVFAPWYNALLFSTMFVGTLFYRLVDGELSGRVVWPAGAAALAVVALSCGQAESRGSYLLTFAVAYALFGLAVVLREKRLPRIVLRIGLVSYSTYLLHPLVLGLVGQPGLKSPSVNAGILIGIVTIVVVISRVTYRLIERPMIGVGHRLSQRREPRRAQVPRLDADTYIPTAG